LAGVTANPDGRWASQQARNLLLVLGERGRRICYLLHDRDAKFTRSLDDVFRSEDAEVLLTPVQAPNADAHAERWVRTARTECLDWLLIVGRGHLEQVLRVYGAHYDTHRPHRALGLEPPAPSAALRVVRDGRVRCTEMTCSVGSCTSTTDEPHERNCAPYGRSWAPPGDQPLGRPVVLARARRSR
jgi:hypothetical protein